MANVSRVTFGGQTIMDITDTTAESADVRQGQIFYAKNGARTVGTATSNVLVGTTEYWDSQRDLIGSENVVYMYTDHLEDGDGNPIPGFKIGDGLAYLIDTPFNDDLFVDHINNTHVHVTDAEKEFWNNKVTAYINASDLETLVLTKN